MPQANGWGLVGLIATSSVLAAFITQGLGWLKDIGGRDREAKFACLYVAIALENYATECSVMITDSHNYEGSDGHFGAPKRNIPELAAYPSEIKWEPLGIVYAEHALNYRAKVIAYRANLDDEWEFGDEEDTIASARRIAADMGLEALSLASNFREARGLGKKPELNENWSVKSHLEAKKAGYARQAQEQEAKRVAREAERAARGDNLPV